MGGSYSSHKKQQSVSTEDYFLNFSRRLHGQLSNSHTIAALSKQHCCGKPGSQEKRSSAKAIGKRTGGQKQQGADAHRVLAEALQRGATNKRGRRPQLFDQRTHPLYGRLHANFSSKNLKKPKHMRFRRKDRSHFLWDCTCKRHLTLLTADAILKYKPNSKTKMGQDIRDPLQCWICKQEDSSELERQAMAALAKHFPKLLYLREVKILRGKFGPTDILILHVDFMLAVEIDGEQHVEHPFSEQALCDAEKDEAYWEHGINLLRIHYKDVYKFKSVLKAALFKCRHRPGKQFKMTSVSYGGERLKMQKRTQSRPTLLKLNRQAVSMPETAGGQSC